MKCLAAALLCLPLMGCLVTAGDLEELQASMGSFEELLADETATTADLKEGFGDLKGSLGRTARMVRDRGENLGISLKEGLAGGGVLSGLSMVLLNLYRNGTRQRELKDVVKRA